MIRCCFIIFILWVSECIISQPLHDAEDPNFPLNFALNITGFNATTFNISSAVLPNNTIPFSINQTYINSSYTFYNATIKEYPAFNFSAINITMVNQTYSEYPSFNSTMFNATLFNQTVFDHTIFNNTIFNSTFFNSTMFNNTMINDTMFNFFNYTMFNYTMLNSTMFNHTMFNYTVLEHPIYNISNSSVPVKSPAQSDLPSPLPSLSPVVESHYRLWIYSELYSSPVCATSSAEYAFGVSSESCVSQSPFFLTFFSLYHPLVKSFKIEGTGWYAFKLSCDILCRLTFIYVMQIVHLLDSDFTKTLLVMRMMQCLTTWKMNCGTLLFLFLVNATQISVMYDTRNLGITRDCCVSLS